MYTLKDTQDGYVIHTPNGGEIHFDRRDLAEDAVASLNNGDEGEDSYYVQPGGGVLGEM